MEETQSSSNKRIAKNTLMLYVRMLLSMVVSLYTSRVVLNTLGVEDYGIYNVVGGVVVLFSFLNSAMASATQRFLNFELGRGDIRQVKRIFSMSMTAHILIALLILVLAETVGLWFFATQLNIPEERMDAASWVYQMSVLTCCFSVLRIPYNASVIAYEKMTFFAYVSIVEVVLKLLIVYLLVLWNFDKLVLYSILTLGVAVLVNLVYQLYCKRTFDTCGYRFFWDKVLFKQIMGFSGWSLFGSMANVGAQQGVSILLNIFCGVAVNAAVGIANQVSAAVYAFVSSFQTAFNPQIVKNYAAGEKERLFSLIFQTSKYSFYLLFILSVPVLLNAHYILELWLGNVPQYAVDFSRLMIVFYLLETFSAPLWMSVQATGKIRNYQIWVAVFIFLNLPLSYIALKLGYSVVWVFVVRVAINVMTLVYRIGYLKKNLEFPAMKYVRTVILPVLVIAALSVSLPLVFSLRLQGLEALIYSSVSFEVLICILILLFGLNKAEKGLLRNILVSKLHFLKIK